MPLSESEFKKVGGKNVKQPEEYRFVVSSVYPQKKVMGWNLRQRIEYEIGIKVHHVNDGQESVFITERELTDDEKNVIREIVADPEVAFDPNPYLVIPGNTIVIKDVWDYKKKMEEKLGIKFHLYYMQTEEFKGTSEFDEIFLLPCTDDYKGARKLTEDEMKKFVFECTNLVRVE